MPPLLSLIVPSRRPNQLTGMLDNIEAMTADYENVEVVVKVDDDVADAIEIMEMEKARRPFVVRYVCTPRHGGVFTLWAGQHEAYSISNPDTYFYIFASDEIRFLNKNWDKTLEKYVGFFPDDIFRLRLSFCKFRNYHKLFDCTFMPESFAIITRRWMEIAEGTGHCWGTDAFHQCVAFHLSAGQGGTSNLWHHGALWRDVQIHDLELGGIEFGKDISAREHFARNLRIFKEWNRLCNYESQLRFSYLARKLYLYCGAMEKELANFSLEKNENLCRVMLRNLDTGRVIEVQSYRLSRIRIFAENIWRQIRMTPSRIRWAILIYLSILIYPKEQFSEPLMDQLTFANYVANKFPRSYILLRFCGVGRPPPKSGDRFLRLRNYLLIKLLAGFAKVRLGAESPFPILNRLMRFVLNMAFSVFATLALSGNNDRAKKWRHLLLHGNLRQLTVALSWYIGARAMASDSGSENPHWIGRALAVLRQAGAYLHRLIDYSVSPWSRKLASPAPGLEPQLDFRAGLINVMMRRLGYPVPDRARLFEAYSAMQTTERALAQTRYKFETHDEPATKP